MGAPRTPWVWLSMLKPAPRLEYSPQGTRAPSQDFEALGPSLTLSPFDFSDSLPSLGLSFPTCTMDWWL